LPQKIVSKLRIYAGIQKAIIQFRPEILFIHDCQFLGIKEIVSYVKKNPEVKIYVDSHTDFINSGKNWVSRNILHRIIYKWCAKKIEPYTTKFYGTLPLRMHFYSQVYGIDNAKIDLLVLGADHTAIDFCNRQKNREKIRNELSIKPSDFVLITGGKIDERKKIHTLLDAMRQLNKHNIHLIFFGLPDEEMTITINNLSNIDNVHKIGWLEPDKIYNYFFAADLGVFPGTHSVLWEQAIGIGLPCLFKRWSGIQHIDVGGNCLFLEKGDKKELIDTILHVKSNGEVYSKMKAVALDKGMSTFSYFEIAKRAIES
jgi:glycosyltransferase involved in cell wall biosynthesis